MPTFSNNIPTTRLHPAPPPPPPPPPLPLYNMQAPSVVNHNDNNNMDAGPSNFNAAFDFGSTYAVASSNYDTPFLSASESNWLFNHADLQFDTQMASSSSGNGGHPDMLTRLAPPPPPQPPPPPPLPAFAQHQPGQRNQVSHSRQNSLPQYSPTQQMPAANTLNGRNGTHSPMSNTFSNINTASSAFPSSLSSILNPAQRRNSRHVHFADANIQETRQEVGDSERLHRPLPPCVNTNGTSQQFNQSQTSAQIPTPKTIKIGLATRNRLAKHLAVSR